MSVTPKQFETVDGIFKILNLIQSIIFLILYIGSYFRIKAKLNEGITLYLKLIMGSNLIFISSYTIRYIFVTISHYIVANGNQLSDGYSTFDETLKDLLFVIGHSTFYLIMILRLYFVFRGSSYALSKRSMAAFIIAWISINIIDVVYFIVERNNDDILSNSYFFFALVLLDIALGVALIVVFTQKLIGMGLESADNETELQSNTGTDADQNENKTELSETQNILVSAATKYALLCGLTILFVNLQFLSSAIYYLTETVQYDFEVVLEVWFFCALFMQFYTIYLSFPTTRNQYECVCGGLHKVFEGMFRANMMSEIERKEAGQKN